MRCPLKKECIGCPSPKHLCETATHLLQIAHHFCMPSLIVTSGVLAGQVFSFRGTAIIGRGQFSNVRLNDATVSRRHAQISDHTTHFELNDLASANGTSHKGLRLSAPVRIEDGDEIQFGQIKTVFRAGNSESPSLVIPVVSVDKATGSHSVVALPNAPVEIVRAHLSLPNELLTRLNWFLSVAGLANTQQPLRVQLSSALDKLLRVFPYSVSAAVYTRVAGDDSLSLLCQCSKPNQSFNPQRTATIMAEAMRQEFGIYLDQAGALQTLAARLGLGESYPATVLGIPLRLNGELLGGLYLDADRNNAWPNTDHELFGGMAALLAWVLGAHRARSEAHSIEVHDLALARRVQQHFLPQSPPQLEGYRFADSYAAARAIGGDYYDFVTFRDGRIGILIADVSGKALSGALYMARLGVQVRFLASQVTGPVELLTKLNQQLYSELEAGMFITMLAAALHPKSGILELVSAGHPNPIWRRRDGSIEPLSVHHATPLGATRDSAYTSIRFTLGAGDLLLFYTDGLDEAHNEQKDLFGHARILSTLIKNDDPQNAIDALLTEVARFAGGEPQSDDLALIALQRLG